MPINFEDGGGVFGQRKGKFSNVSFEPEDIIVVSYSTVGTGEETAYTVTTGKVFYITKWVFAHVSGAGATTIKIDDKTLWIGGPASQTSVEMDFAVPLSLASALTIKIDSDAAANILTVIGYEV